MEKSWWKKVDEFFYGNKSAEEVAEALQNMVTRPKHTVLYMFWTGHFCFYAIIVSNYQPLVHLYAQNGVYCL